MTDGLTFLWSARTWAGTPAIGGGKYQPTRHGMAYVGAVGSGNGLSFGLANKPIPAGSSEYTILSLAAPVAGAAGTRQSLFTQGSDAAPPYTQYALMADAADATGAVGSFNVQEYDNARLAEGWSTAGWVDGGWHQFIGRRLGSSSAVFRDGMNVTAGSYTNTATSAATVGDTKIGGAFGSSRVCVAPIALTAVWTRALSDVEIAQLARNPWQLFDPRARRVLYSLSGGTTHNVSLTEAANASETISRIATLAAAATEAVTAAETIARVRSTAATRTEPATAADAVAATRVTAASATEAASAGDSATTGAVQSAASAEAATAADAQAAARTAGAAQGESASAADAQAATRQTAAALTEAAAATEALAAALTAVALVAEAVIAADACATGPEVSAGLSESITPADLVQAVASVVAQVAEAGNASDQTAAAALLVAALMQPATATDSVASSIAQIHAVSVVEIAGALEILLGSILSAEVILTSPKSLVLSAAARPLPLDLDARQAGQPLRDRLRRLGTIFRQS